VRRIHARRRKHIRRRIHMTRILPFLEYLVLPEDSG
jgi:hypothetical protein